MTYFSDAQARISPSATTAVMERARALKAQGRDIISLAIGEPDFEAPDHVKKAAYLAIKEGRTKYTPIDGLPDLKDAVRQRVRSDTGLSYDLNQISISAGGKHSLYNALVATLNSGDEVIIPAPYWVSYPEMVRLAGGTPVTVPTNTESGLKLTADSLAKAISEKTKWLILNSPNNPTGAVYSENELEALAEVLRAHPQVHVVSDEIYKAIAFDGQNAPSFAAIAPDLGARTLTVSGAAKAYAMTGWRIGWALGETDLIAAMRKIQSQSTGCPCAISQAATIAALSGPQGYLGDRAIAFQERRDFVKATLLPPTELTCTTPAGAFYLFPSIAEYLGRTNADGQKIEDDIHLAEYLIDTVGVATVPGTAFGAPGHLRLSIATDQETLDLACRRIVDGLAALR